MYRITPPPLPPWLDVQLPFDRYCVDVGPHRLHIMEQGHGRPVLLLHGNPTWGYLWRKVARELAGEPLRLVMPDLVGLGLSDKPRDASAHNLQAHGQWIARLIEMLDLKDIVFVGQDWGGPIGLRALAHSPGRLAGMVILNTAIAPPKPGFKPTSFHRFSNLPLISDGAFRLLGFPQVALHLVQGDKGSIRGEVARAYRYPLRHLADRAAPLALARMVPSSLEHPSVPDLRIVQELVEGFKGPAAIVWGEADPVLGRLLRRVSASIPQASVTKTAAGHFLQEEVPVEIAAAIREVVGQLEAAAA